MHLRKKEAQRNQGWTAEDDALLDFIQRPYKNPPLGVR